MAKVRIGDIIRNNMGVHNTYYDKEKAWASRYFVYMGVNGKYIRGIELVDSLRFDNSMFYKSDFKDLDNNPNFDIVGHSEGFEMIKDELIKERP